RGPRGGNDDHVDEFNCQGNDEGVESNGGLEGVNGNVEGVNRGVGGAPDFSTIIAQLVPHLVTTKSRKIERYVYGLTLQIHRMVVATEPNTMHKAVQISDALTDEAVRNGSIKKEERIHVLGLTVPPATSPVHPEGLVAHALTVTAQVRRNQGNQATGRAFMLGAEEARQNPNIVTSAFTLNNYFATTLFDLGADYSFVSTNFVPLLGIDPSESGFRYEIKIASGQLVEINKVIKGCKLEIEGHVFNVDLILFGHGSFDVIIGMNWLSNHKAEIIYHEKVVKIPLLDGKVLRVLGERPKEKARLLMSTKTRDKKQEEIVVVRDFPGFLGHVINGYGIHVDPSKIEAVKNWKAPKTPSEGEEPENAFQTLKDKLCNALVLALPDVPKDYGAVVFAFKIWRHYMYGTKSERVKPKRVRAMNMTLQSSIKDRILVAQKKTVDEFVGLQRGLDEMIEHRSDGTLYYLDRIWVPFKGDVRTLIMDKAYKSKYLIHQGADKMYYDLGDRYEKDIVVYIKDRLKVARDRQKSYANKRKKPLEFSVGDFVVLKVSPWKGMVHFRKKGKLAPRLNFVEEPVEILEREFKKLKRSMIAIVKVWWNSKRGPEFTWECEIR
nr:hypothetical protein [Tanacetum cinerariifolium]